MPGENSGGGPDAGYTPPRKPPASGHPTQRRKPPKYNKGNSGHPTQRKRTFTPKSPKPRSGGSGGYDGGGSGYIGSNGYGSLGGVSTAPVTPPPPSLEEFLGGDETYQGQLAAIKKALANYRAQMGERTDEYNADFASRLKDLNLSEDRATTDQADDYAGRGMFISGLYGKARGDLERDYNNRESDMTRAKSDFLSGLNRDFVNFQEEQDLTQQRARMDAVNRRALKYAL